MAVFDLDKDHSASFFPYLDRYGYAAKGTTFRRGKPVKIFEAQSRMMSELEKAARQKSAEVHE